MNRQEIQDILDKQIAGLVDFVSGYKACAKVVLDSFDKKEINGSGIQANAGNTEGA